MNFPRNHFNISKYNLSFYVNYSNDSGAKSTTSIDTIVEISPPGWVLTIVAVSSAILGVILRVAMDSGSRAAPENFLGNVAQLIISAKGIGAAILALVAYNAFEHTELAKDVKIKVNWRGALLIGTLCGLFSERFLLALKALVGG